MSRRKIATFKVKDKPYPISAKDIFTKWARLNRKIMGDIVEYEGKDIIHLDVLSDEYCTSKCLTQTKLISKEQLCPGCEMLSRFMFDPIVSDDGIINIDIMRSKIKRTFEGCSSFDYTLNEGLNELSRDILSKMDKVNPYETQITKYHYYTKCGLLNYSVISMLMDKICKLKNFPHSTNLYWFYGCDRNIVTVDKISKMGVNSMEEYFNMMQTDERSSPKSPENKIENILSENAVYDVISQLVCILNFFSKYNFSHGSPTIEHLSISEKVVDYTCKQFKIYSSYTLSVIPSNYSSINHSKSRFYYSGQRNIFPDIPVKFTCFISNIPTNVECDIDYCEEYYNLRVVGFKVQDGYLEMLREEGIPILSTAWDFTCFMISLLSKESFYNTFIDSEFINVWKNCWKYDEYSELMKDVESLHTFKRHSFDNIYNILKKYYIRTDILNVFIEELS